MQFKPATLIKHASKEYGNCVLFELVVNGMVAKTSVRRQDIDDFCTAHNFRIVKEEESFFPSLRPERH